MRDLTAKVRGAFRDPGALRALLPGLLALAVAGWLGAELNRELQAPLFRDASMSQYTAWCIRQGFRLYEDVGAPDGPFIHFLYAACQVFVGTSDHGARVANLVLHVALSALMGLVLAPRTSPRWAGIARGSWAVGAAVAWLSWYLTGGWEQTVQRDPDYALFGYLGLVLLYRAPSWGPLKARAGVLAGAVLVTSELFTRQSGVIYPLAGLALLLFADAPRRDRRLLVALGFAGAAVTIAGFLGAVAWFGSLRGFVFWYFRYPLESHRFIGRQPFWYLLSDVYRPVLELVGLAALITGLLVGRRIVPARALVFAGVALGFLLAACAVGKGWINHVQQTTAALNLIALVAVSEAWSKESAVAPWRSATGWVGMVVLLVLSTRVVLALHESVFDLRVHMTSSTVDAATAVAEHLHRRTEPEDRIFYYAHDAHGLLYAERMSAIPYYVDMLLNLEVFIEQQPPAEGLEMTAAQQGRFDRLQADIARDACDRLMNDPPAAIVIAPHDLGIWSMDDPMAELGELCPPLPALMAVRYEETVVGEQSIFYRDDR